MDYGSRNSTDESNDTMQATFDVHSGLDESKSMFNHWTYFVGWAAFGSYFIYFAVGGFLHVSEKLEVNCYLS